MNVDKRLIAYLLAAVAVGLLMGYMLGNQMLQMGAKSPQKLDLPDDLRAKVDRFTFINHVTNETLKDFRIIAKTVGTYEEGGTVFETYVLGFEDRFTGAEADQDFLDLMVELKRARGSDLVTVRIVQLGLDTIDVYLDEQFLRSVRPTIEVQIGR